MLKLSDSTIVLLKSIPVCFELNNLNFGDLEHEMNTTVNIKNMIFLIVNNLLW